MKSSKSIVIGLTAVWLGTLAAAYLFGKSQFGGKSGSRGTETILNEGNVGNAGSGNSGPRSLYTRIGNGKSSGNSAEDPAGGRTVKQIMAQLTSLMRSGGMQNPRTMMKAMGLLDQIPANKLQEALAEVEANSDPQTRMMVQMSLLGKWAETDGPAAMAYAEEHSTGMGMMAGMAKMGAAAAWAEHDPEAVWKWYLEAEKTNPSTGNFGGNSMVLSSIFSQLAANDPDAAFKRLSELEGPARTMALSGLAQSAIFDSEKRDNIMSKINTLTDESEKKQARQMLLGSWAMMEPDGALEWVKKQPKEQQAELKEPLGSMLMMSNPKKGAEMIMEGADDKNRAMKVTSVIGSWAHQDINAAGEWLKNQPPGAYLDQGKNMFATIAAERDGESAMAWAGTIEDPSTKLSAMTGAYKVWSKKQPTEATAALQNAGLTPEQIAGIQAGGATTSPVSPLPPTVVKEQAPR